MNNLTELITKASDLLKQNLDDQVISLLTNDILIKNNHFLLYILRGIALSNLYDPNAAIADYNQAISLNPESSQAYNQRGNTWASKSEFDKALEDYTQAIRLNPDNCQSYIQRGDVWTTKKEFDRAIDDYSKAIELDTKSLQAYIQRGHAWMSKYKFEKASSDYKKAAKLNPKSVPAYLNLRNAQRTISKERANVFIYLSEQEIPLFVTEDITRSCGDFMEALGFELKTEDEPIYGSFWKRITFAFSKYTTPEEIDEVFCKGKKALQLKFVDFPTAEQTEKLAASAEKVVTSLNNVEEAVVRLGAILIIKNRVDNKSKVIIQQLSFEQIKILDEKPQLLQSPRTVYELLTGDIGKEKLIDDGESEIVIE